jgi:adenosylcobyric acid synthase
VAQAQAGTPVLGICGGYQMLGAAIYDPDASESDIPEVSGLGLLPVVTHFSPEKQTIRAEGQVAVGQGLFGRAHSLPCSGYEIHMGRTVLADGALPLLHITQRGDQPVSDTDGATTADGSIAGTYLHGMFDNDGLRHSLLANLAARSGAAYAPVRSHFDREAQYDRLAAVVRTHLDIDHLYNIIDG